MKFSFYTGLIAAASLASELQAISVDGSETESTADVSSFDDKSLLLAPSTDALEIAQTGSAVDAEWGRRKKKKKPQKTAFQIAQERAQRDAARLQRQAQ